MTDRTAGPDLGEPTLADLARRVDELRERVHHTEPETAALLEETLEAITDFNRAGLVSLVQLLRSDPRGAELLYESVDIAEVMAMFVAHDIVRADRTLDVLRAVDQLRPYLAASSIELEVMSVDGDVAHVRFGTGCSAPSAAVRDEVRASILSRVPGLVAVQEVAPPASPQAFVPLQTLRVGPP
jgi:Fe-S cluster biogenesis protein NfuA